MNYSDNNFVVLIVIDGWGVSQPGPGNAISLAKTINFNKYWSSYPHTQLEAAGQSVGLPKGEAGNTETGHLNLGAGRIVYQDLERINMSIADGTFFTNSTILGAINHSKKNNSFLNLVGLVGAGGVHSNIEHLYAVLRLCKSQKFSNVNIHIITDGRDSPPTSSLTYINLLRDVIKKEGVGRIASIMGRYWAMDRDRRWDRTEKAYDALTQGKGQLVKSPDEAVNSSYDEGITDEFIKPSVICDNSGIPLGIIKDNDSIIFYNFRIDRPRQLSAAFLINNFTEQVTFDFDPYMEKYEKTHMTLKVKDYQKPFNRTVFLKNLYFCTMTEYSKILVEAGAKVAFPPENVIMPLGRVISSHGLNQLRVSESEKERFVTFYFNGQVEQSFQGEDKLIIPSPDVPTYDLRPEMSAFEMTQKVIANIGEGIYKFVLINFANPDMVGHTGNIGPAVKACEVVDDCIGKIVDYSLSIGGTCILTSDHGNCEEMINPHTGQVNTEHSSNPVPLIIISKKYLGKSFSLPSGILADVAPTILSILKIEAPSQMSGRNLLSQINLN